jgi:hypothetical protein
MNPIGLHSTHGMSTDLDQFAGAAMMEMRCIMAFCFGMGKYWRLLNIF